MTSTDGITVSEVEIGNILTRTTGFLRTVTSHSLQPYRGCSFGNSLCGVGCYVQHNGHLLKGRRWGSFLEVRTNAAQSYRRNYERERRWARRQPDSTLVTNGGDRLQRSGPVERSQFSIFCSSSTDPFVPQESRFGITRSVLQAMTRLPPDELILQTHTHLIEKSLPLIVDVARVCDLRVHISIETDRNTLPGLPPHASPIERRFEVCRQLRAAGIRVVVTVSPLLPIADPELFFKRISESADGVVIDHFIGGDGSEDGRRTRRTGLVQAMAAIDPESVSIDYRDRMVEEATRIMPDRVGVSIDGFAGRFLH